MSERVHLLCAGAAQGLVKAVQPRFEAATGAALVARFGAVGAMKEALLGGAPCDLMIVTDAMVDALCREGLLRAGSRAVLGSVRTGVAVRAGSPHPEVGTPAALKAALLASREIYFPDPQRATAGIHFARVMDELGVRVQLEPRFRTFPAGAIAMRELAAASGPGLIGCTQVSEILYTPGVELAGLLPPQFELITPYTAALATAGAAPALAEALLALLAGAATQALRAAGGFEAVPVPGES